ncbi:glucosamine-6-phosphate deaminase [Corynebacterium falsenii]|uniref:glucosamine-6-phosphate deaminase n=1 Tax=Corynebacterium falsenii TaxID=108486 RepID=UPI003FD69A70
MEIIIVDNSDQVSTTAADVIAAHAELGHTLGLATGSTPEGTYRELIHRYRHGDLSFNRCTAFLLDEYVGLPKDHEQTYYCTIRRQLTSHIDIADERVHSPDGTAAHPGEAAEEYERLIARSGGIDVQILGIGTDGHIGFNEPTSSLASRTRIKTLHPDTVRDNARFFEGDESRVPHQVITQGIGTILDSRHLVMIATGESKAHAVRAMVEGPVSAMCPASALQLHQHVTVILDRAAVAELSNVDYYTYAFSHKPQWQGF